MLEAINYWKRLKRRIGRRWLMFNGDNPKDYTSYPSKHRTANDKDKHSGEPLYVVTVTKVEESSALRGNESLARVVCSDTALPLTRLV